MKLYFKKPNGYSAAKYEKIIGETRTSKKEEILEMTNNKN